MNEKQRERLIETIKAMEPKDRLEFVYNLLQACDVKIASRLECGQFWFVVSS